MKGSISKREGPRGVVWYGKFSITDPATGKRSHKRISAKTRKDCEAKMREAISASESGKVLPDSKLPLRVFLEQWLATVEPNVRPSTYRRYADIAQKRVIPDLGNVPLTKLTPMHLQSLYTKHLNAGLSRTTVHHIHAVIHRALGQAMRWGLVDRKISDLVDAPRGPAPDITTWSPDETAEFLSYADRSDLAALWRLALLCGMRRGEILGLRWEDVDLDRATLAVRRTLIRGKGGSWELGQPKTKASRRSIALPDSCVQALQKHRAAQRAERLRLGPVWEDNEFVFTNRTGGPLHVNSLVAQFGRLTRDSGVPKIRFHDMRHTCATLLLAEGVHPKIVQERLGHSEISMTLNRYSHVTPTMQRQAADTLDSLISRVSEAAS
jgi:integrase